MSTGIDKYKESIYAMIKKSKGPSVVDETNVYQKGNTELLPYIDAMVEDNLLPGSELRHLEHAVELLELAKSGKRCLILAEHYSNFDMPVIHYLLRAQGDAGKAVADAMVAIAGIKLNEANPLVLAFTEAYSRIVIYPSRSIESLKGKEDSAEVQAELAKSMAVNRAAMKALAESKESGEIILVFPAGTRYRPWAPETKKGVREIDSYMKTFDYVMLMSLNGNMLRPSPDDAMEKDLVIKDTMIVDCAKPILTKEYRNQVQVAEDSGEDRKQAIVDKVMADLELMHEAVEKTRPATA